MDLCMPWPKVEAVGPLAGSVLPFYHVGLGSWTQVIRLGGKHFYPLSQISSPRFLKFVLPFSPGKKKEICCLPFSNIHKIISTKTELVSKGKTVEMYTGVL